MTNTNELQPIQQTVNIMKYTFVLLPIAAGADKFTNLLTNWEQYLSPTIVSMLPISASAFMMIIGVIEIAAGVIVWKKPVIGGYIVAAWLSLVALSLLAGMHYMDVAVRDIIMAIFAYSMARLSKIVY